MDEYQYNALYKVKYSELISEYSKIFWKHFSDDDNCMRDIKHTEINYFTGHPTLYLKGFVKEYKNICRRYILDLDGKWYEQPNASYVGKGHEVNPITLEAFVIDVYHAYHWSKKEENKIE